MWTTCFPGSTAISNGSCCDTICGMPSIESFAPFRASIGQLRTSIALGAHSAVIGCCWPPVSATVESILKPRAGRRSCARPAGRGTPRNRFREWSRVGRRSPVSRRSDHWRTNQKSGPLRRDGLSRRLQCKSRRLRRRRPPRRLAWERCSLFAASRAFGFPHRSPWESRCRHYPSTHSNCSRLRREHPMRDQARRRSEASGPPADWPEPLCRFVNRQESAERLRPIART